MFTSTPFFPHSSGGIFGSDLFRLLDSATADLVPASFGPRHHVARRSFSPRFDVREVGQEYQLQGELPGMEQKDLDIEFVDERTLVIRGRSAREEGERLSLSSDAQNAGPRRKTGSQGDNDDAASEKSVNYRKASAVEEEEEEEEGYVDAGAESSEQGAKTPGSAEAMETKRAEVEPAFKYWISERAVGEFERRFSFPGRVNQEEVKASLRNGILSVVVPKLVAREGRRIEIQ